MDVSDEGKIANSAAEKDQQASSASTESGEGSDWQDAEPEADEERFVCLYNDETLSSLAELLDHCKKLHGFDLADTIQRLELDFYSIVKLVNYIRSRVKEGLEIPTELQAKDAFSDEKYLQPVLEDDALLFNLDEVRPPRQELVQRPKGPTRERSQSWVSRDRLEALEDELRRLQSQFGAYQVAVKKALDDRLEKSDPKSIGVGAAGRSRKSNQLAQIPENPDDESHYFKSYSYNEIHEIMLKDTVRTDSYRDFIYDNKHLFQDKVVLDVGCGTGILSMFCAKAGAKMVIAVDNSAIIDKARENVAENNLQDTVKCLRGKIEEVVLPVPEVDIIISEWMGYCLLYEAMLNSVIWARDRYLKPTGLMVPSHATLKLAPLSDPDYIASHISFWHSVYGFSMTAMLASIYDDVLTVSTEQSTIVAPGATFLHLDLHKAQISDLTFTRPFTSTLNRDVDALDGWAVWFDIFFAASRNDVISADDDAANPKSTAAPVAFTTGPNGPETHWRQGILLVEHGKGVKPRAIKAGETVTGSIEYRLPKQNSRELNIEMKWDVEGGDESSRNPYKQMWKL